MALRAGRVGVSPDIVDNNGFIKNMGGGEPVDTYTKEEIDQKLSGKANTSDVYTQSQVDTLLNGKADKSDTYTKNATNTILLDLLPDLFDTPPNVEASGNPLVLTDSAGGNAAECIVTLEPIQSGSGTPSPQNVRPISGRTQSVVTRTGKNLAQLEQGTISTTTGAETPSTTRVRTQFMMVEQGVTYIATSQNNGWAIRNGVGYDEQFNFVANTIFPNATTGLFVNNNPNIKYVRFVYSHSDASEICTPSDFWYQFEYGTTATAYEPYNGEDYTISLGQTVYGGTLDVTTGELTITNVKATYDGSNDENWERYTGGSAGSFAMKVSPPSTMLIPIISDIAVISNYLESLPRSASWGSYSAFISNSDVGNIVTGLNTITTVEDWRTYLASNNLIVCYDLATPTTVQLTPTQITLLKGDNVLTTNGTSIALSYPVDVASYIRRKLGMSTESTRALSKSLASEEIQEEVKEVSDLTPLEEVVEINTVEPVATVTTTKTTKRTSTKKPTRRK